MPVPIHFSGNTKASVKNSTLKVFRSCDTHITRVTIINTNILTLPSGRQTIYCCKKNVTKMRMGKRRPPEDQTTLLVNCDPRKVI